MVSWIDLPSVLTSIVSGVLVVLLIECFIVLKKWRQRRSAVSDLRTFFLDFKTDLESVQGAQDGRFSREEAQFARWTAHLEDARIEASSHGSHLSREQLVEITEVIAGQQRMASMISTNTPGIPGPSTDIYDQYFDRLRTLRWLTLDG